ncbi:MAG TPA: hypothetical protein VMR52_03145 [Dehalococcoidia bacterium]|nr:hypothetical protein [Dehalococcoidia bacterium]
MSAPVVEVFGASARAYVRQPINIVLLIILPPLLIIAMNSAISTFSDVIGGNLGERAGTGLAGLWAASLLTGAAVFFVLRTSLQTDARLVVAGLSELSLSSAHAIATLLIALITTLISFLMLVATQEVGDALNLFAAILASALIYGAIGTLLAWFIEGDLEVSFVIILIFMLVAFVGGPLGGSTGLVANLFPLHFTSEIAVASMLGDSFPGEWFVYSGLYLAAIIAAYPAARWLRGRS